MKRAKPSDLVDSLLYELRRGGYGHNVKHEDAIKLLERAFADGAKRKAKAISNYLLTGMHHATAEGQAEIARIIAEK